MTSCGIILIGLRGSGKSSLGQALADLLRRDFFDLDVLLARRHDRSVAELLRELGETAFRSAERDLFKKLVLTLREHNAVVSLGGGSLESPEIEQWIAGLRRDNGYVAVWLEVPLPELVRRIKAQSDTERPRLLGRSLEEELRLLLARRAGLYKRNTDVRFRNVSGDPLAMAVALLERLPQGRD